MTTISKLDAFARLAQAAYAELNSSAVYTDSGSYLITASKLVLAPNSPFSPSQAKLLTDQYQVLNQYRDDNLATGGFSATLFQDKSRPGHLVLSFAGTEFETDRIRDLLLTDAAIGIAGYAQPQVLGLYRYVKQLQTGAGQAVRYGDHELESLYQLAGGGGGQYLSLAEFSTALRNDRGVDVGQGQGVPLMPVGREVDLVGHSLGGHLAMLTQRLFPGAFDDVVVFNAPGFLAGPLAFPGMPAALLAEHRMSQFGFWDPSKIVRIEAVGDGVSELGNVKPGSVLSVNIETRSGLIDPITSNHSMTNMADGLALMALLSELDTSIGDRPQTGMELLAAMSKEPGNTYEQMLDHVRTAILGSGQTPTPQDVLDVKFLSPSREPFYAGLVELRSSEQFQALAGKVDIAPCSIYAFYMQSQAKTDFCALLALKDLSPIFLMPRGEAALDVLRNMHAQTYADWQSDLNARLYGDTDHVYAYSDTWLSDRAAMLRAVVRRNEADLSGILPTEGSGRQNLHYLDVSSGTDLLVGAGSAQLAHVVFGAEAADELTGEGFGDHLYGGAGADILIGLGGNDHLEGGDGADTLNGGAGADWLEGGQGFDTYVFATRDGRDTVVDLDGQGCVVVDGVVLSGGRQPAPDVWCSDDGRWIYRLSFQGDLLINDAKAGVEGSIVIKGWRALAGDSGQALGIRLEGKVPLPEDGMTVYRGDQHAPVFKTEAGVEYYDWDQTYWTADGTLGGGVSAPGYADVLQGQVGPWREHMMGLGGDDRLDGQGGDDVLEGGDGNDLLAGGKGSDVLFGGAGNDWLYTSGTAGAPRPWRPQSLWVPNIPADEVLASGYGWGVFVPKGAGFSYVEGVNPGRYVPAPDEEEFADGGDGDDSLIGGHGRDRLLGGSGADELSGCGGDDWLLGEDGNDQLQGDGQVVYLDAMNWAAGELHGNDYLDGGVGNDLLYGGGGADVLVGGVGDDVLRGDGVWFETLDPLFHGKDLLEGGDGNDALYGGGGNDSLQGGAGDDIVYGETGDDLLDGGGGQDLLAGGLGDDLYRVGSVGLAGHVRICDFEGFNSLELDVPWSEVQVRWVDPESGDRPPDSLPLQELSSMLPGSLAITVGQQTVWVDGGLAGAIRTVRAVDGELGIQDFLQRFVTSPVSLASDMAGLNALGSLYQVTNSADLPAGAGRTLWGGSGDDTLTAHVAGTVMRGGRGRDRLVMDSMGNRIELSAGDGSDVLVNQAGGHHTVALGANLSLDDAQLVLDAQGRLTLDLGRGASLALAGHPLDRLNDSTVVSELTQGSDSLSWTGLVARGVRFDGTDQSEAVMGTDVQDTLLGGGGNDLLLGGDGDDWLDGGAGANRLAGGRGNDTYRVGAVAGETRIEDTDGANVLRLGAGLDPQSARVQTDASNGDWLIQWDGDVTIRLARGTPNAVQWLELEDGQRWSLVDWARGRMAAEDQLQNGTGSSTVQLLRGHGVDVLTVLPTEVRFSFGAGIRWEDLVVTRGTQEGLAWLDLHYGQGDVLRLQGDAAAAGFSVALADGTWLERNQLLSIALDEASVVQGTASDEVLYGLAGADVMAGGGGVDVLRGGRGNDAYRMSLGGFDTVEDDDGGPNGVQALGDPQQMRALRLGGDLMLEYGAANGAGSSGEVSRLRVRGFFDSDVPWSITWADGSQQDLRPWVQQTLMNQDTDIRREAFYQRILNGEPEFRQTRQNSIDGSASTRIDRVVRDVRQMDSAQQVEAASRYERIDLDDEFLGTAQVTGQYNQTTYQTHYFPGSMQWVGASDLGFFPNGHASDTWRMEIPAGSSLHYQPRNDGATDVYLMQDPREETVAVNSLVSYTYTASLWNYREEWRQTVVDVRGGDQDNRIAVSFMDPWGQVRSALVSAGGGDDVVQALACTSDQPELVGHRLGHFLDGGAGHDRIHGSAFVDEISGGSGRDLLSGAGGNDLYIVEARDDGIDAIYDLDAALMGYLGDLDLQPLLDQARTQGLSRQDTVRLGAGIRPEDVRVSWSMAGVGGLPLADANASDAWWGSQRALLLSWGRPDGSQGGLRVAYDAALADAVGFGVERYEFADGTVMTQADMVALAGPDPAQAGQSSVQRDPDGTTSVYSTTTHTLSRTRDHVVLLGDADINAVGNDRANVLLGNAGANRLNGKGGADIMAGGMGHDIYRVDDAGDVVSELASQGTDRIYTTVNYALPDNVEELYASSDAGLTLQAGMAGSLLVGRAGDDTLVGARGNDTLKGGAGADTLVGGGGENLLIGGAGADRYLLGGSERNTVRETADLAGELDVVVLTDTDILSARFEVDGNDLLLGSYRAQNRIENAFASRGAARVDRFEFKGGDSLTWAQVDAIAHQRASVYEFLPPPPEPPLPSFDPVTPPWYVPTSDVELA